jgi:SulP family sulfate permease
MMTNTPQTTSGGFTNDAWGGLAAMLVALPSSIAFGVLVYSGIGPEHAGEGALAGILGAATLGIIAPLVSRNGGFISAPCAPAAALLSALALQFAESNYSPGRIAVLLSLTALLAALLQLLYEMVRAGRLIKFIPYQVVSGYLSGVAVVIAIGQLPKLLGLPKNVPLARGLISPELWSWTAIAVGAVTIFAITLAPRIVQKVPAAIIGLLAGIAAYFALAAFNPDLLKLTGNPLVIGSIETSGSLVESVNLRLAALVAVRLVDIGLVLVSSLTLSLLLSIDTLKTGVVVDALLRSRHDSNRELLGQGVANAASALVGGMPGAGTMGATLVNITSGGRSSWSGVMEGAFVVAAFVLVGGLIAWVPIGALAGLLLAVAWRMFDKGIFRLALQPSTRLDFGVIVAVLIVAQFDLIAASATGICLAILLFIRDQIRGSVIISKSDLRATRSKRRRLVAESDLLQRGGDQAMVVQLYGNLFFGTTDALFSELEKDLRTLRYLLFDLRRVQSMDFTAAHLLEQMRERLQERGGELLFSGMPSSLPTHYDIENYLVELGLVRAHGGIRIFDTRDGAIQWMEERILEAAGWEPHDQTAPLALQQIELLAGLGTKEIAELAGAVTEISVKSGGRVFSSGDQTDDMFLVRRGRVHALLPLTGDKRHHLTTFEAGDFFGELAFLDHQGRSADAEVETPTDLYVLSRKRFDKLMRTNPALCGEFFERLALALSKRLRMADTELRVLEQR